MNSSYDLATNVSNMSVPSPPPVLALPPALLLGLVLLAYIPVAITSTTSLTTKSTTSLISAITWYPPRSFWLQQQGLFCWLHRWIFFKKLHISIKRIVCISFDLVFYIDTKIEFEANILHICHFFYTTTIWGLRILHLEARKCSIKVVSRQNSVN